MKAKMSELYNLEEKLGNFIVENSSLVMGKVSVVLHYNYRILRESLSEYLSERDNIIIKYGTPNENGGYAIESSNKEVVNKALTEIAAIGVIEIDVPIITFSIEDLYALAESVPSGEIGDLIWMTKEYQETINKN